MADQWYCLIDQQEYGPATWDQVVALAQAGQLTAAHHVRRVTDGQWTPATQIPGLFQAPAAQPAAPRPASQAMPAPQQAAPAPARPAPVVPVQAAPMQGAPAQVAPAHAQVAPVQVAPVTPIAGQPAAGMPVGVVTPAAAPAPAATQADAAERAEQLRQQAEKKRTKTVVLALLGVGFFLIVGLILINKMGKKDPKDTDVADNEIKFFDEEPEKTSPQPKPADTAPELGVAKVGTESPAEEAAKTITAKMPKVKRWLDASKKAKGGLRLDGKNYASFRLSSAWISDGDTGRELTVEVLVANPSDENTLTFTQWKEGGPPALAADDADLPWPIKATADLSRDLAPGAELKVPLTFAVPEEAPVFESVRLALSYESVGKTGDIGFTLPQTWISDSPTAPGQPVPETAPKDTGSKVDPNTIEGLRKSIEGDAPKPKKENPLLKNTDSE